MTVPSFMGDVASEVIAGLAVFVIVTLGGFLTFGRMRRIWRTLKFSNRMKRAGISNFFCSRQEFSTLKVGRSLSEYILTAEKELIYVGFYLSGGTDRARVDRALASLLQRRCHVELVLLDPDIEEDALQRIEEFLAIATGTLRGALQNAVAHFIAFAGSLSAEDRSRFVLRRHRTILACSAFLIDLGEVKARMLIDTKIHGAGRDFSYAMEFEGVPSAPSLAAEYAASFMRIAHRANVIPFP
jgi:hypothetical protein